MKAYYVLLFTFISSGSDSDCQMSMLKKFKPLAHTKHQTKDESQNTDSPRSLLYQAVKLVTMDAWVCLNDFWLT